MTDGFILPLDDLLARLPLPPTPKWPEGERYIEAFAQGGFCAGLFAPRGIDHQTPHTRDELYIVVTGAATFEMAGEARPVAPGDLIFVPAEAEHRFTAIGADFATWVIFLPKTDALDARSGEAHSVPASGSISGSPVSAETGEGASRQ